jgi:hypothetical protein
MSMEVRLLSTSYQRRIFVERLRQARDEQLTHFTGVTNGQVDNRARLAASELYGLFPDSGSPAESMIAGMAIHDLEMFPRTCPGPDLSHWPERAVFECSDHWSVAPGAGMKMWCGAAIQIARRNPRAVLAYLAVGMSDHWGFYRAMGFVPFGRPVQFIYLKTAEGFPWVQPVILRDEALEKLVAASSQMPVETDDEFATLRFKKGLRLRPFVVPSAQQVAWEVQTPIAYGESQGMQACA